MGDANKERLLTDQIAYFFRKLFKPILPLVVAIIVIIISIVHYSIFTSLHIVEEKFRVTANFLTVIIPILIIIAILNIFIEDYKNFKNPGRNFWVMVVGIIISPIVVFLINSEYLYMSLFIEFFFILKMLLKSKKCL
ncbi:hypothetical protein [Paenibacillus sp. BGI2013]|uniref:hypothetical protein n=1 Tax=Paenibacillus sp. BGI2013 TaxID=2058902 RepID=UPI0015D5D101|nr:hypothetical protein [Paenibacillus sp. BGI2013]